MYKEHRYRLCSPRMDMRHRDSSLTQIFMLTHTYACMPTARAMSRCPVHSITHEAWAFGCFLWLETLAPELDIICLLTYCILFPFEVEQSRHSRLFGSS